MSARSPEGGDHQPALKPWQSGLYLGVVVVGYIGIYLCRKNFSVANPLIQEEFGVGKEAVGNIASISTIAYAVGKLFFGPVIDRLGGRTCFLASLLTVGVFGGLGAFAPTLGLISVTYSLNRFAGAAGWGSMLKLIPDWFRPRSRPFAVAVLSQSFVFGGVVATLLAAQISHWSGNNWRWVMGGPSLVLLVILAFCWLVLPRRSTEQIGPPADHGNVPVPVLDDAERLTGSLWTRLKDIFSVRQFWVICALSFTLTLLRETFNTWTVDFFRTEGGPEVSNRIAAFLSTPFDICGGAGILFVGWLFGRIARRARNQLLFVILALLAALLVALPQLAMQGLALATVAVGVVGFLAYGPYSLLGGILSLEIRGRAMAATVAGLVDGVGYLAGILSGKAFGWLLDSGGYSLAFPCLGVLAAISAVLCLGLYPRDPVTLRAPGPGA